MVDFFDCDLRWRILRISHQTAKQRRSCCSKTSALTGLPSYALTCIDLFRSFSVLHFKFLIFFIALTAPIVLYIQGVNQPKLVCRAEASEGGTSRQKGNPMKDNARHVPGSTP